MEQILVIWGAFQASMRGCPEPAVFVPMHVHIYAYNATAGLATCTGSLQYCIYLWDPSILCAVAIPTYLLIHFYRTELSVGVGAVPISAATDNPFLGAPGPQNYADTLSAPVSSTTTSPRTRNRGTTPSTASTRLVCSSSSREHGADGMGGVSCPERGFSAP